MRILILSEDKNFTDFLCDVAYDAGVDYISCSAISVAETLLKKGFDKLIIDSEIEDQSGEDVFKYFVKLMPDMKFLIFTHEADKLEKEFITKPFPLSELLLHFKE